MQKLERRRSGTSFSKETMRDPYYLPTYEEVVDTFNLRETDGRQEWPGLWNVCDHVGMNEVLTSEFIERLGQHLMTSIFRFGAVAESPVMILEVAAGNGRLTYFLNLFLSKHAPGLARVIATDIPERDKPCHKSPFAVEMYDYREALGHFNPTIVLCSWMPGGDDWTIDFRNKSCVLEYLLIGPEISAIGTESMWDLNMVHPRYAREGFKWQRLEELSMFQISKMGLSPRSVTNSFVRRK